MRSFAILTTLFAAAAIAAPAANNDIIPARAPRPAISDVTAQAESAISAKQDDGCEVLSRFPYLAILNPKY